MHFDRLVPDMQDRSFTHPLMRVGRQHGDFAHRRQRNPVTLAPCSHHESRCNQQCEREAQGKLRPHASNGFDVDVAVHAFDDTFDHIHADSSSRLIADLIGRRKSRHKNKLDDFGFRDRTGHLRADQSSLNGLGPDLFDIEPGSIVFDFDQHRTPAMRRVEINRASGRLPLRHANSRKLDPMIDRVTHEVHQRVDQPLHDTCIDFSMFTGCDQRHVFPCRTRHLSCGPPESGERRADRHHTGSSDFIPHTEGQLCQVTHVFM